MSKKQFSSYMLISFTALIVVVILLLNYINQPAVVGEMTVVCEEESCGVYSNTVAIVDGDTTSTFASVDLEEIYDEIPEITIGHYFSVQYSENYYDDGMSYSLYTSDLVALYEDNSTFTLPPSEGTYIIKMMVSWGNKEKDLIVTENYFIVHYS